MSWRACDDPVPGDTKSCDQIEMVIVPRSRDLGGFEVRRALPSARRQMVGPFIFWDQMGPSRFLAGEGIDVRPHPHIGLATITYLFEGKIYHRDSVGSSEPIEPGDVNWMTAGRGIVHSERTEPDWKAQDNRNLFGIQSWVALPKAAEESEPGFTHIDRTDLPMLDGEGKAVRLIVGSMFGLTSPLKTASEMIYADASLEAGASVPFEAVQEDRAVYVAEGAIKIAGDRFEAGQLLILRPGDEITVTAQTYARILLLGGEPIDGPRHIWWNFVSSSKERIEQAKEEWRTGKFDLVPGDEAEFIPLPE